MLDRLSAGLVALPADAYDVVTILSDPLSKQPTSVDRNIIGMVYGALRGGGVVRRDAGGFGADGWERTEGILAGFIAGETGGMRKPDGGAEAGVVKLSFGKKRASNGGIKSVGGGEVKKQAEVGFVDFGDDLDELITGDDELVDEDDLLTEDDRIRGIVQRRLIAYLVINLD